MIRGSVKFLVAILLFSVLCVGSVFAGDLAGNTPSGGTFKLSALTKLVAFLTGLLPGAVVMVKFVLDIVKAYANREQNPAGIQKAVVNFLIVVAVLVCYSVAISALFEGQAGNEAGGQDSTASQGNKFLTGVTGSEVSEDWLAEHGIELPADGAALEFGL